MILKLGDFDRNIVVVTKIKRPGDKTTLKKDSENVMNAIAKETGIKKDFIKSNVDKLHAIGKVKNDK